jgi:benzil reductase ((S)-benzoin forming)
MGNCMSRNIFITGQTSGFGLGLKRCFLDNGYNVYGLSRSCIEDDFNLKIDLKEIKNLTEKIDYFMKNKKFDLAILNAGVLGGLKKVTDISITEMINIFSINVISTKLIIDSAIRNKSCGNFIVISSGAANKGYDGWLNYCISKSSLRQMVHCYAIENPQLRFISLSPGTIKTKMQDEIVNEDPDVFSSVGKFIKLYDCNPTPEQVAKKMYKNINLLNDLENGSFFDLRSINDQ